MKTRFNIYPELFLSHMSLEEIYQYYEDYYKKSGFVLDKETEDVYKDFDREIHLNEGDRVDLFGFRIVTFKYIDLHNDLIVYVLKEEE